jgi:hypothetical protein
MLPLGLGAAVNTSISNALGAGGGMAASGGGGGMGQVGGWQPVGKVAGWGRWGDGSQCGQAKKLK